MNHAEIVNDIEKLGHSVWLDDNLSGSQKWWDQILFQIRKTDILVFILSEKSRDSTACKREYGYAAGLGKPILPIIVTKDVSVNTLPTSLSQYQFINYQERNADSMLELVTSLAHIDTSSKLPNPLPKPPEVPISYIATIAAKIETDKKLGFSEQSALLIQLKELYYKTKSKSDVISYLKKLQNKPELVASIDKEINHFFEQVNNAKKLSTSTTEVEFKKKNKEGRLSHKTNLNNQETGSNSLSSNEALQLLDELLITKTEPQRRMEIGNLVDQMGDPRKGVGLDKLGIPDIEWVEIPAAIYIYQQDEKKYLDRFYLGRYPVTNIQFQAFIDDDGYDVSSLLSRLYSKKGADQWWTDLNGKKSPPKKQWSHNNRPCGNISWFDAVAFCRWFSAKKNYEVRLPTEMEWEKGARGIDGSEYPWGNNHQIGFMNAKDKKRKKMGGFFNETCAVGLFPQGQSPYGLMDMSGNTWEWCLNKFKKPEITSIDSTRKYRVIRGGSWASPVEVACSAHRGQSSPKQRESHLGFRLFTLSPVSEKKD